MRGCWVRRWGRGVAITSHWICVMIACRSWTCILTEKSTSIISVFSWWTSATTAEEASKSTPATASAAASAVTQGGSNEFPNVTWKNITKAREEPVETRWTARWWRSSCCVTGCRPSERGSTESSIVTITIAIVTSTAVVRRVRGIIEWRLSCPCSSSSRSRSFCCRYFRSCWEIPNVCVRSWCWGWVEGTFYSFVWFFVSRRGSWSGWV